MKISFCVALFLLACSQMGAANEFWENWDISASAGYGERTNPILNADNLETFINIDIAWYGDRFFFDNGDMGINLHNTDNLSLNLVGQLNNERAFFGRANNEFVSFGDPRIRPAELDLEFEQNTPPRGEDNDLDSDDQSGPQESSDRKATPAQPLGIASTEISNLLTSIDQTAIDSDNNAGIEYKVADKNYAYEVGVELLADGDWGEIRISLLQDISRQHRGQRASLAYGSTNIFGRWIVQPSIGMEWKSDTLTDYYFGVTEDESNALISEYEASASLNYFSRLLVNYAITKNLFWGLAVEQETLDSEITNSPIIVEDRILTAYTGVKYIF